MNLRIVATAVLALAATYACAHRAPVQHDASALEQLQQRHAAFLAALGARDAEQTASYFADDAVLHVANMPPVQGRTAIAMFYGNVFRFMTTSRPTTETVRVAASADLAYTAGSVTNAFQGEQGPVSYAGKYLLVWERRASVWSIVVYSLSSNSR
jgi:ketosteroid isomerase-like protein